ncbi:MAG: hypothetical protein AAB638_00865 [Patescibacteria group bacterium]
MKAPQTCLDLLLQLQREVERHTYVSQAFRNHDIHISRKAQLKMLETTRIVDIVKHQMHDATYNPSLV